MSVNSEYVLSKLRSVLSEDIFDYATTAYIYSETKSLTYNYIGMSEFRDALTHVKRAVNADNEQKVASEMDSAFEHIRRAAVESMQFYVEMKYLDLRTRLKSPYLYLFKSTYTMDRNMIRRADEEIKELLVCARDSKPKTEWQESIGYFYKSDEKMDILNEIIPSKAEINSRLNISIIFVLTIIFIILIIRPL
jgi:hypothetical protein